LYDKTFGRLMRSRKNMLICFNQRETSSLLINQILDMSKVEAGKMKLALSSLPMKSLLMIFHCW